MRRGCWSLFIWLKMTLCWLCKGIYLDISFVNVLFSNDFCAAQCCVFKRVKNDALCIVLFEVFVLESFLFQLALFIVVWEHYQQLRKLRNKSGEGPPAGVDNVDSNDDHCSDSRLLLLLRICWLQWSLELRLLLSWDWGAHLRLLLRIFHWQILLHKGDTNNFLFSSNTSAFNSQVFLVSSALKCFHCRRIKRLQMMERSE